MPAEILRRISEGEEMENEQQQQFNNEGSFLNITHHVHKFDHEER